MPLEELEFGCHHYPTYIQQTTIYFSPFFSGRSFGGIKPQPLSPKKNRPPAWRSLELVLELPPGFAQQKGRSDGKGFGLPKKKQIGFGYIIYKKKSHHLQQKSRVKITSFTKKNMLYS